MPRASSNPSRGMALPTALSEKPWFPDPRTAVGLPGYPGLVAVGGDLSTERLLLAYRSGLFPWSVNPLTWWSPDPRGIFELDRFHVSRSLARTLRQRRFEITIDRAFGEVMRGCAEAKRSHTWIGPEFIEAYTRLHQQGHAHSVECWREGTLAGGIYGVAVGGLFAGESMFHRVADASKLALYHLVQSLKQNGYGLFDIQMLTPITERLGAIAITRDEYLERLQDAVKRECVFPAAISV